MIENISGIHETVTYMPSTHLKFYNNNISECYPKHWHTPIEIIMAVENSYLIEIGDCRIHLNTGDIIFICPGVIHSLYAPSSGARLIFQAEISSLRNIKGLESVLSLMSPAFIITPLNRPKIHCEIQEKLMRIYSIYNENNMLTELTIYSTLLEVFSLIGFNYTENMVQTDQKKNMQLEYTNKFINICDYINEHCIENLSLDQISKIAGFSKYHFTRLFKQYTNITFYKYLNQKRVAYVELLLANSEKSITEIALCSGFNNLSTFIRIFKIEKKCTPTEYRKMYIH